MRRVALSVVLSLASAGCLGALSSPEEVTAAALDAPLAMGARADISGACAGACAPLAFELDPSPGALFELRIAWNGTLTRGLTLEIDLPDGTRESGVRGFDAARVLLRDPAPGAYVARVAGDGAWDGWLGLRAFGEPRGEGADLAPNLVTLVPSDVAFGECDLYERVEQGAVRCLRLGNAVGNTGDGPLEVALVPAEGLGAVAMRGAFVQNIYQVDGAPRAVDAGDAQFHPMHAHFHYRGLARFSLHEVDETTGLRGDLVTDHHKAGFCLLDIGEMREADVEPESSGERRAEQDCLVPRGANGWTMGVSRGFYDLYVSRLSDQYVEASGVPDGLYELVSECNWAATLHELDPTDNAASVLVRIAGDTVEVLEERGFYRLPE